MPEPIYITGVVIANGVPDSDGDVLNKKEIKTIFTKYLDKQTDTMHNRIKNEGVEILGNWITESDMELNGDTVPAGSWLATFAVTDEKLINSLQTRELNGLSLGSVTEEAMDPKYWFINKSITYGETKSIDEVNPLFISFVDSGANGFTLEILSHEAYINKRKTSDNMSEDKNNEEMIPISVLDRFKDIFIHKNDKSSEEEEKTDNNIDKSEDGDMSNKELLEKLPEAVAGAVVSALQEAANSTGGDDSEIDKADESEEEKEDKDDDSEINKSNSNNNNDDNSDSDSTTNGSDAEINKRATTKPENIVDTTPESDFYSRTGRDHLGRKIRN